MAHEQGLLSSILALRQASWAQTPDPVAQITCLIVIGLPMQAQRSRRNPRQNVWEGLSGQHVATKLPNMQEFLQARAQVRYSSPAAAQGRCMCSIRLRRAPDTP